MCHSFRGRAVQLPEKDAVEGILMLSDRLNLLASEVSPNSKLLDDIQVQIPHNMASS